MAFYAYMSHDESSPSSHHAVIFDHVITNIGGGYNPYTGAFIVPVAGTYVITTTILAFGHMGMYITVNGHTFGTVYPDAGNPGTYDTSTGIVVLSLNVGDAVQIITISNPKPYGNIISRDNYGRSTFSGWLI